jgi:hypothetical protein
MRYRGSLEEEEEVEEEERRGRRRRRRRGGRGPRDFLSVRRRAKSGENTRKRASALSVSSRKF